MANEALDAFLAENAAQEAPQAPAAPTGTGPSGPPKSPAAEAKPSATLTAPAKAKETPPDDEPDAEPPAPQLGEAVIPRHALEDERRRRQDWKERAVKAETQHAELMRQLEEAKRAPPPPVQQQPPPQMQPLPDPSQDPIGFARGFAIQQQQMLLNERLNNSELLLREKVGDETVAEYVNEFKQHAERDPALFGKLYQQTHPYGWMMKEVDRLRLQRDIGDDPAKYRERLIAEERAKWEQEAAQRGPAVPQAAPVPGMQPSLANARSVAGRTAPAWTGEPSLEDVLAPVQNRRNANGQFTRRF